MPQRPDVRRRDEKRPLHGSAVELEHFMCILDRQLKWGLAGLYKPTPGLEPGTPSLRGKDD